jgi:hypothetical protein
MKSLLHLLILLLITGACQQAAPVTNVAQQTALAADSVIAMTKDSSAQEELPRLFSAADTLSPPMRELLATHDLAKLWQHYDSEDDNPTFVGYFGPDHYRFAILFEEVTRDLNDPVVYHIKGKSRYYKSKNTRSFSGTLTVRQITDLDYPGFLKSQSRLNSDTLSYLNGRTYTARAQLQLQEAKQADSGVFEGAAVLDFFVVPGETPDYVHVFDHEGYDDRLPTRGSGLIVHGNRRNLSTGQVKSFLVSPSLGAIAPDIFKDFMLDERMGQINPKYTKLGWNDYWRNDEWWADSPKPSLNL